MDHGTDFTEGCGETVIAPSGTQGGSPGCLFAEGRWTDFTSSGFYFSEEAVDEAAASISQVGGEDRHPEWYPRQPAVGCKYAGLTLEM